MTPTGNLVFEYRLQFQGVTVTVFESNGYSDEECVPGLGQRHENKAGRDVQQRADHTALE